MSENEKILGADAAAVGNDTAVAPAAASHAAHTPGPWTLRLWMVETAHGKIPNVNNDGGRYVMAEDGRIALVDCRTDFKRGGHLTVCAERDANAHLIAAAPELLEALKAALLIMRHVCTELGVEHCVRCKAAAAIAKAEGRS